MKTLVKIAAVAGLAGALALAAATPSVARHRRKAAAKSHYGYYHSQRYYNYGYAYAPGYSYYGYYNNDQLRLLQQ